MLMTLLSYLKEILGDEVRGTASKGLEIMANWLYSLELSLNLKKTKYIAFSLTSSQKCRPSYNTIPILTENIQEVKIIRYLGIIIDHNLKWKDHTEHLNVKIRQLIHKFYLLRDILNQKTMILIYKSLIESILRYGIVIWGGTYINALHCIDITHKYLIKTMLN